MSANPIIEVSQLTYLYPGLRALDNITFSIKQGAITALVGPNGAGKTTLLKCLAAIAPPHHGTIHVNGTDVVADPRTAHRDLGFLLDFFGLYDGLTVRQCLQYFAMAHEVPQEEIQSRIEEVLGRLNLMDKIDVSVAGLSRGMRQRLAIGQAIIHRPKVLLLDEPASGLDPEARIQLGQLFLKLRDEGMTLIVSSHILAELDAYADELMILKYGQLVEHGQTGSQGDGYVLFDVVLLDVNPAATEILGALETVQEVKLHESGKVIQFMIQNDPVVQHQVLQHLMQSGLKVVSYNKRQKNLQDHYLATVK